MTQLDLSLESEQSEMVVKANELVMSQLDFTTREYRIFMTHVSQIQKGANGVNDLSVSIKQLCELSDTKTESLYSEIRVIADRLTDKKIEVEDANGRNAGGFFNVYSSCTYDADKGEITGSFTQKMKPLLLKLKEHFTMYHRRNALSLRSVYAMRFFEILKRYEYQGAFSLSVDRIRVLFNLEDKYKRFADLKRKVIDKAKDELDKKDGISFKYEVVRDGRTPVEVDFEITGQDEIPLPEPSGDTPEYVTEFQNLPEDQKERVYEQAKNAARRVNPDLDPESQSFKAQVWRFVKRIMGED